MNKTCVSTLTMALLSLSIVAAPHAVEATDQASATVATRPFHVCGAGLPRAYVVPTEPAPLRAVLEFPNRQRITVESSIPEPVGPDEWVRARFDYRIVIGNIGPQYHITFLGATAHDKEELAYRFLDSVGVSCLPSSDAIVYFSFQVNGSDRDYVYVGLRVSNGTIPILLGRSEYGVLVLDRNDPSRFSIWDSSQLTSGNGMGPHDYKVTEYRWNPGGTSVDVVGRHDAGVYEPGNILGDDLKSIRVGAPPLLPKKQVPR